MKRIMLAACLAAFAMPAMAGTITITVTTATGACITPCTKTYTDSDTNLAKIAATYATPCALKQGSACSPQQTLLYWFNTWISHTIDDVTANDLRNTAYTPINPQ